MAQFTLCIIWFVQTLNCSIASLSLAGDICCMSLSLLLKLDNQQGKESDSPQIHCVAFKLDYFSKLQIFMYSPLTHNMN